VDNRGSTRLCMMGEHISRPCGQASRGLACLDRDSALEEYVEDVACQLGRNGRRRFRIRQAYQSCGVAAEARSPQFGIGILFNEVRTHGEDIRTIHGCGGSEGGMQTRLLSLEPM
jgi:hypothetical protein